MESFIDQLTELLNKFGIDSDLNIPDFILANAIHNYLGNLQQIQKELEDFDRSE
jgi:hypothetical protein